MVDKSGVLDDAPLVFVLAAIRVLPLESLPKWIPEIQEGLRDELPVFSKMRQAQTPQGLEVSIDHPDFSPDQPGSAWLFSNPERTLTVQLSRVSLVVHSISYDRFSNFAASLQLALDSLVSQARRLNIEMVGIRYVDHIRPADGRSLEDYVPKELLPYKWKSPATVIGGMSVNSYSLGDARLQVNLRTGAGNPVIPEDLLPAYMSGKEVAQLDTSSIQRLDGNSGTLDMDASRQNMGGKQMDVSELVKLVDELHVVANSFFRNVCTDVAFDDWRTR